MHKLKTLHIAFYQSKYPDAIDFPSVFDEIQSSRLYSGDMKQSNLGKTFAYFEMHRINQ